MTTKCALCEKPGAVVKIQSKVICDDCLKLAAMKFRTLDAFREGLGRATLNDLRQKVKLLPEKKSPSPPPPEAV